MIKKVSKKITPQQLLEQQKQQEQNQRMCDTVSQNLHLSEKQSKKFVAQANALRRNLMLRRNQRNLWQMTVMPEEQDIDVTVDNQDQSQIKE